MEEESNIQWASPGQLNSVYQQDRDDEVDAFESTKTKTKRKYKWEVKTGEEFTVVGSIISAQRCLDKLEELCPDGYSLACQPYTSKKTVKKYVKRVKKQVLAHSEIRTFTQFKTVAKEHNILALKEGVEFDPHQTGTLAFFDGEMLDANNELVACDRFPTMESLPPIPHAATDFVALLKTWKDAKWRVNNMEKELSANIRAAGNSTSTPFFLDLFRSLLSASGWSFKSNKFHTRELRLDAFYKNFKLLTEDYAAQAERVRFVVLYTTPYKLRLQLQFNILQRGDVYKILWNGFPVESGGTSSNRQYTLSYLAIKSHEDAIASEIVNTLLVRAIYHLFGKLWRPRNFGLDHAYAFYNANLTFPSIVKWVCQLLNITDLAIEITEYTEGVVKLTQAVCYAHCQRKINEKKHFFVEAERFDTFKQDVGHLRVIHHPLLVGEEEDALHEAALRLLLVKYSDEEYISEWFETNWCGKWGTWRDGSLPAGKPKHQNGPEEKHKDIHLFLTDRKLLTLGHYNEACRKYLYHESLLDEENPMLECVTYETLKARSTVDKQNKLSAKATIFTSLLKDPNNPPACVGDFDAFYHTLNGFVVIQELPPPAPGPFHFYSCACHEFDVAKACEHSLAFGIYKEKFKAPIGKDLDLIGRQPQIGRPPKPRGALQRQPGGARNKESQKLKRKIDAKAKGKQPATTVTDDDFDELGSQAAGPSLKCELCKKATRAAKMLLCDICDKGFHYDCLQPPLDGVPENCWFCGRCQFNPA
ncbi:hypothetical protein CYMTET_55594 [Cymbomonas tetramitiformis]|uniref:PHD-type domain-containing protein n=1 Tax=Cymbomonas tetramitiformis TaxID=36881 RepID=A0AAE0BDV4_9CHLO|nr:hypothetical protein CYMTET_55594 [Cymbomonas tetramitiformis]